MTTATVDDVLDGVFALIVAVVQAIAVLASAIVGLWMLKYLANTIGHVMKKAPRI